MTKTFDAIIIGAGQAGPPLAAKLTAAGQTVALIEREQVGGTCVNTGCTPTKAMVASAKVAHSVAHAQEYGISIGGTAKVDFDAVLRRALAMSANSRNSLESWLDGMDGLTLVRGHARFTGPKRISVGGDSYEAEQIFLNVGARAAIPDIPGLDQVDVLTNSDLFWLEERPQHLVIVGGSYIGLEFAQMFRRFGSRVTVVERGPHLAAKEDPEISEAIRDVLETEGIAVRSNADCIRFSRSDAGPVVGVDCTSGEPEISCSHILLAVGRQPNTDDLSLDQTGVEIDERGFVRVNDRLETNIPGIWALGDCNGEGAFTHTSYNDYEIVASNLLDGGDRKVSDRVMSYALYIDPPLGRTGLSETEALAKGHTVLIGKRPMTRVGRAKEKGETQGLMKIVVDADTRAILGGAIFGTGGDEAIHSILDMIEMGAKVDALTNTMHIHPTVAELVPTIAGALAPASDARK
ncbi:pyruvate/2-oxoglutarate dehydrogenase complex dihydrolipoamide dehydrogenase (E3) component [Devosia subaequoris]|uniref:Pyruvate/2-oxoglutarate dehydrogenase complex dihydrolipoamide dehydrogenase (E3) component n=1 Tax=Devosia subaequoris TaxID=395930 RepID=A0A7W6IP39_9HYPH|nr:FAD-containing oxidoreductase [Devosia subaequoris]MBB4052585.1 pyruvate/2-oxoglutarate dehydrogenase complex dihydrolipoamide dehydrogenase (E3) component [Devosia subaequoris]MCP1209741.1 FAD-containing oxidoreductase [Devosia subaequoris]